jgi:hypothetical protein
LRRVDGDRTADALAGGVAFVSDADLEAALDEAQVSPASCDAALDAPG